MYVLLHNSLYRVVQVFFIVYSPVYCTTVYKHCYSQLTLDCIVRICKMPDSIL